MASSKSEADHSGQFVCREVGGIELAKPRNESQLHLRDDVKRLFHIPCIACLESSCSCTRYTRFPPAILLQHMSSMPRNDSPYCERIESCIKSSAMATQERQHRNGYWRVVTGRKVCTVQEVEKSTGCVQVFLDLNRLRVPLRIKSATTPHSPHLDGTA